MIYLYAILLMISGFLIAWFGQKHYGPTLAITNLFTSLLFYLIANADSGYPYFGIFLLITASITLGIWFFSKFFTYLLVWEVLVVVLIILMTKITDEKSGLIVLAIFVVPAVIVYFTRKIIINLTIGLISGLNVAIGLLVIILMEKFKTGAIFMEQPTYMLVILLLFLVGGVYFQFSPFANKEVSAKEEEQLP
ncbi:MAG: hypothetical protein ABF242_09695 [Flavobacteriales bacterium]